MTNASDNAPHPDEMTDDQLDQLLHAGSASLLDHITATADLNRTLTAIMTRTDQPAETLVTTMIKLRDAAHDVASAVTKTPFPMSSRDVLHVKDRISELRGNLIADDAPVLALALELATAEPLKLTYDLENVIDSASRLASVPAGGFSAFDSAVGMARAVQTIEILDGFLHLGLGPTDHLLLDFSFSSDDDSKVQEEAAADYLHRYLDLGRDLVRDISHAMRIAQTNAMDHAQAIARHFDSRELDASGEDLSSIEIRNLDTLDRITWTRETTWPTVVADYVEEHSHEIQPGVYQVHVGDTRGRRVLLTLT